MSTEADTFRKFVVPKLHISKFGGADLLRNAVSQLQTLSNMP